MLSNTCPPRSWIPASIHIPFKHQLLSIPPESDESKKRSCQDDARSIRKELVYRHKNIPRSSRAQGKGNWECECETGEAGEEKVSSEEGMVSSYAPTKSDSTVEKLGLI
jgi:hypothetical protein